MVKWMQCFFSDFSSKASSASVCVCLWIWNIRFPIGQFGKDLDQYISLLLSIMSPTSGCIVEAYFIQHQLIKVGFGRKCQIVLQPLCSPCFSTHFSDYNVFRSNCLSRKTKNKTERQRWQSDGLCAPYRSMDIQHDGDPTSQQAYISVFLLPRHIRFWC